MFVELFAKSALFKDLEPSELEQIVQVCNVEELKHGEYVFREGDEGERLYLIAEGAVRISRQIAGMGEEALVVLKEGAYFGEMSLFDGHPRSADAIVDSRCLLLSITRDDFMAIIEADKEVAYKVQSAMIGILSERLRMSNEQLRSIMIMAMF